MQGGTGLIPGWGTRDPHALHAAKYKMKIQHLWLKTTNTDYLSLCVCVCVSGAWEQLTWLVQAHSLSKLTVKMSLGPRFDAKA